MVGINLTKKYVEKISNSSSQSYYARNAYICVEASSNFVDLGLFKWNKKKNLLKTIRVEKLKFVNKHPHVVEI